jgi:putative polyketide hydroxylase
MGWALARMAQERGGPAADLPVDYSTVGLGYRYGSSSLTEDPRRPSGSPGTRAPHLPLGRLSTVDAFRREPVLLTNSLSWAQAAKECRVVTHRVDHPRFGSAYGVGADGASLVRPDGFIAWRSSLDASAEELRGALAAMYRGEFS